MRHPGLCSAGGQHRWAGLGRGRVTRVRVVRLLRAPAGRRQGPSSTTTRRTSEASLLLLQGVERGVLAAQVLQEDLGLRLHTPHHSQA